MAILPRSLHRTKRHGTVQHYCKRVLLTLKMRKMIYLKVLSLEVCSWLLELSYIPFPYPFVNYYSGIVSEEKSPKKIVNVSTHE